MTQVLDRIRSGVDTAQLYWTFDGITAEPTLGVFQFRARNHWIDGAHNRSTIQGFYGAGQEDDGHPLARAYRDVRAGSFMHPLGANRAYELLGDVALGREVALH